MATSRVTEHDLRRLFIWQVASRAIVVTLFTSLTVWLFYQAALTQQAERLTEIAQNYAGLVSAMEGHAEEHYAATQSLASLQAHTLEQLRAAHNRFPGIGKTGEFTLAREEQKQIVFLLSHRHKDMDIPKPVPLEGVLAEPMRRALSGQSGTLLGLDYRGERVMAAYLPIPILDWGIVAKIDLAEVRAPYIRAGSIIVLLAAFVVSFSAYLMLRSLRPYIDAVKNSEERYRLLVENQADLVVSFDPQLKLNFVSDNYCRVFNRSREELLSGSFVPLIHPDDQSAVRDSLREVFSPPYETSHEERAMTRDGWRWFHWSDRARLDDKGEVREIIAVGRDIHARKMAEQDLAEAIRKLEQHAVVFDNALEAILITDAERKILSVNPAFCRITGYSAEEVLGKTPAILSSKQHDERFFQQIFTELKQHGSWQGEILNRRKDGAIFPAWETITCVAEDHGRGDCTDRYVAIFSDISARKLEEERIRWLAHHDALTELPNRVLFEERCEHALPRARRSNSRLAILFIDLDRFKPVNDSLGHSVGDKLLQRLAGRLSEVVRQEDTVARIGGDEFAILLEEVTALQDVEFVAEKLLTELSRPVDIGEHTIQVGGSVGIALFPDTAESLAALIAKADTAMYQAKQAGRGRYAYAQPD